MEILTKLRITKYYADENGVDVWLVDQDDTHRYVYPGGYNILRQEAIDALSYVTTTWNCDEKCVEKCREYNDEDVKEYIRENMYEFLMKNLDKLVFERFLAWRS